MIAILKSEFRKLLTVRSTYVIIALAFVLIGIYTFYFEGYVGNTGSAAAKVGPLALKEIASNGAGMGALFISIIAVLFMAHEYRYSTIMYTLTANVRRTRVFFGKLLTISIFGIIFGMVFIAFAFASYMLGLALRGAELPPQDFNTLVELGKVTFYYMGYALVGILLAIITRSVVVAIATLLIFPAVIEPLLGLLLKTNAKYLPFTALDSTVGATISQSTLSPKNAIITSACYLLIATIIGWLLFVRRDAN